MELTKERMLEIAEILYSRDFCFGDSCCKHCEKVLAVDSRDVICFYNRVIDLLQADAEGRLVVLPCKVGGIVYCETDYIGIYPHTVELFYIRESGLEAEAYSFDGNGDTLGDFFFEEDDIGKTVFLTHEEAEAALEKMGGGE